MSREKTLDDIFDDMENRNVKHVYMEEIPALTSLGKNTISDIQRRLMLDKKDKSITEMDVWDKIKKGEIETSLILDMYRPKNRIK